MKTPRINKFPRPLLAIAALVVAFSVVSAPMANALFYNYIRDAFTLWGEGAWTDLNADANVASCEPAVQSSGGPSWMVEPFTDILETNASYGYLDAYYNSRSAYSYWYLYAAFNDLANLNSYLATIKSWDEAYTEVISEAQQGYTEESSVAATAYGEAYFSGTPEERAAAGEAEATAYSAYYDAAYANDTYYDYAMGEYGYNTWASYSAPYYGTYYFLQQLGSLVYSQYSNTNSAAYYDFGMPVFGTPEYEALEAYQEELRDYYFPIAEYYSAYSEYYRGLSDYYEG